jgi:hypothetical protein
MGLQPYLYREGFVFHLIPFTPDTANKDQMGKTNTMVMYNNVMTKFKWGNFKTAKYLDHESTNMFYPVLLETFLDLTNDLIAQKRPELAVKVLQKCDEVLPDINPYIDVNVRKLYLAEASFKLNDVVQGDKFANDIDDYLTDQLDYNYYLLQNNSEDLDPRTVNIGVQLIGALSEFTKDAHQTALYNKLNAQYKDYQTKFGNVLSRQQ